MQRGSSLDAILVSKKTSMHLTPPPSTAQPPLRVSQVTQPRMAVLQTHAHLMCWRLKRGRRGRGKGGEKAGFPERLERTAFK